MPVRCRIQKNPHRLASRSPLRTNPLTGDRPIVSALVRAADERDLRLARARLRECVGAFDRSEELPQPNIVCRLWSDPVPAVLNRGPPPHDGSRDPPPGLVRDGWPDGSVAVQLLPAAIASSLFASLDQPDKISMRRPRRDRDHASVPAFATQFYLMPLARRLSLDGGSARTADADLRLHHGAARHWVNRTFVCHIFRVSRRTSTMS